MLSILYPETAPHLRALPVGLLPFRHTQTGKLMLAIKATKKMILAAQMNQGFKFYVVPLASTIGTMPALVTAFFDDADEPLILMTPLFDDEMPRDVRELLAPGSGIQANLADKARRLGIPVWKLGKGGA